MEATKFLVAAALVLMVLFLFQRLVPALIGWAVARPLFAALIVALFSILYRGFGVEYGVPDLFWHEDPGVQFGAGISVIVLIGMISVVFFATDPLLVVLKDTEGHTAALTAETKVERAAEAATVPATKADVTAAPTGPPNLGLASLFANPPQHAGYEHGFVTPPGSWPAKSNPVQHPIAAIHPSVATASDLLALTSEPRQAPPLLVTGLPPSAMGSVITHASPLTASPSPLAPSGPVSQSSDKSVPNELGGGLGHVLHSKAFASANPAYAAVGVIPGRLEPRLIDRFHVCCQLMIDGPSKRDLSRDRRFEDSDDVISSFLVSPPQWIRERFKSMARDDSPEKWSAYPFPLRICKVMVPVVLTILLLVPPFVVSVVDRAWAWWQGFDHGPLLGDGFLLIGAVCGSVAVFLAAVLWEFLLVGQGFVSIAKSLRVVPPELLWILLPIGSAVATFVASVSSQFPAATSICIVFFNIAVIGGGLTCLKALCERQDGGLREFGRWVGPLGLIILVIVVTAANGRDPYKLAFPHLELGPEASPIEFRPSDQAVPIARARAAKLFDDGTALEAWRKVQSARQGRQKPRLVVVAVSGGGIAASVWTALTLKAIEEKCDHFPGSMRVVTGASGGMLGAAAYVASLPTPKAGQPASHEPGTLDSLVHGLEQDSLSAVARRAAIPDLLSIVYPGRVTADRGRVLESTWEQNTAKTPGAADSPLAQPFRDLAEGERLGWRPSLIVSPLIAEESAPMIISNLNLEGLHRVEFFKLFAGAQVVDADRLKLSTAIRMNASFPLVSPAVSLPTDPPLRIVDAGYYDNYGVSTAVAWLTLNFNWLAEHTSGVMLIQIRAYPLSAPTDTSPTPMRWIGNAMQWLTTPIQVVAGARKRVMIDRNSDLIDSFGRAFAATAPSVPFKTAEFQCEESAALSWYISKKDREKLEWQARPSLPSEDFLAAIRRGLNQATEADQRQAREVDKHRNEKSPVHFGFELYKVREFLAGRSS